MTSQVSSRYLPISSEGIPDGDVKDLYDQLEEEGSLRWLFFSNECKSSEEFLALVRDYKNMFYVVVDMKKKELVCVLWLNSRTSINCGFHGAFFKKYFGKSTHIMREVLAWLFKDLGFLESLLCFIPETNRLANRFVNKVGWIKAGTIPKLIKDVKTSELVSGNMYYITKDEV